MLLKHLLMILGLGVLIEHLVVLVDFKYLRVQATANHVLVRTDAELTLDNAILAIDAVCKLGDIDVAERLTEKAKADGIKKGSLSCTILSTDQGHLALVERDLGEVVPIRKKVLPTKFLKDNHLSLRFIYTEASRPSIGFFSEYQAGTIPFFHLANLAFSPR
jgi:hypothetical protein